MPPHTFRTASLTSFRLTACLAILLLFCWRPESHAESITERVTGSAKVPWQISANNVAYDNQTGSYHASGQVIIEKQATRLMADQVTFNQQTMTAEASGNVVMSVGEDTLTGERIELDLDKETGVIHEGSLFIQENHFYIRGRRIAKTGEESYHAEDGSLTTCDGDRPDWIITARTLDVTIEGYGSATHAVLKARRLPVLYTPYLFFPAKTRRQTGLLFPHLGFSDRKGFSWDQPLFVTLGKSADTTLYAHYMEERGLKAGIETRWAATDTSLGTIMADGLKDKKIDDGTAEATDKWGYGDDSYTRTNEERYWLRAKIDQELFGGLMARLDLDVVSDQDYLDEFKKGNSGYEATRDAFLETFGRDIDTYDEDIRANRLNINRTWSRFTFNGDILWNDNVTQRRWESSDDTLQQLPRIQFSAAKQSVFGSGLYWDMQSEYTYFYREDGQRGQRGDLYPRLYLPLNWKNYLSIEPSAGWRGTAWALDSQENTTLERSTRRQIYDARLDLSTEFSKVMGSPLASVDRIRHSIKPRAIYSYIPDKDQSDLPDFGTDIDRIASANTVTYSLTNTFTARSLLSSPAARTAEKEEPAADPNALAAPAYDYSQFCRFYLEQTYDIDLARDDDPRPFSDLFGELDLQFGPWFALDSDAKFDTYEERFTEYSVGGAISDYRGDRLWVEHRFERDKIESIRGTLALKLTDRLALRGEYERDIKKRNDILKGAGLRYQAQCWSIDLFYAKEGDDNNISFALNLMGIGGFGN